MKIRKHMSLMTELLIGTIGSILVVALFLSISYTLVIMHNVRKSTTGAVSQTMETLNEEVSCILGEYNDMVINLSKVIPVLEDREQMKAVIQSLGKGLPQETLLYYATAEQIWDGGTLISHSGWEAPGDFDMQSRLWHKNAVNNRNKLCYTEPFNDVNTGKLIVTISYNVLDDRGNLLGVSAFDIVLDELTEAVKNITLSENSKIHIVTKDGLYLTNKDSSAIMSKNYFDTADIKSFTKTAYFDGQKKVFIEGSSYYGVRKIEDTDWFIVADGPVSDFAAEQMQLVSYVTVALLFIILFMLVIDIFLSKKVSKCFNYMAAGCAYIAKGDFSKKYPDYFTKEASLLAKGFNDLSESLHDIVESMKQSRTSLGRAGDELKNGTLDTQAAISQIISSTKGMEGNLVSQNSSVEQTSSSVNKILKNITSLEGLVQNQAQSVQGASSAVEEMIGNIGEVNRHVDQMALSFTRLAHDADEGAKTQNELQNQISEIENQSKLLSEANTVIASIAEQTNLLAMNAAIEAAHAGEAGKGFAVVADEIRKLSETSSSQSKTIGEQLKNIQNTIETVVKATQKGVQGYTHLASEINETDNLVQQIKAAMGEQQEGSVQITQSLSEMNDSTHSVQKASQEMTAGSRTIMDELATLQKETSAMQNGMGEMNASADKISTTGTALTEISEIMEKSIIEIGKQIDRFEN
ncbi:MAG: methyl-accepting chemotaxis protein [Treponema sp.]|nr:methyl-accepting chemotaxis protein [Treponema sp.]